MAQHHQQQQQQQQQQPPPPHLPTAPADRIRIRPATKADAPAMAEVFFRSFNAPFWLCFMPETPFMRGWWEEAWAKGLDNPSDRTFVAVDADADAGAGGRIVGFSRWQVPQADGGLEHDSWPPIRPEDGAWDMDLVSRFFGGMDENREELMGKRPHWFLDMLGVHEDYQRQGIAGSLILWGTEQADKDGLDTFLHGSEKGQPYYIKYHGFRVRKDVVVPDRPEYGSFKYKTMVREPQAPGA